MLHTLITDNATAVYYRIAVKSALCRCVICYQVKQNINKQMPPPVDKPTTPSPANRVKAKTQKYVIYFFVALNVCTFYYGLMLNPNRKLKI